jgi:hypothetical protein
VKVGDLVRHKFVDGPGVILKTPAQTGNGDFLVKFSTGQPTFCRELYLEVCSEAR